MTDGEKLPLSERVFYGFNAVSQWAMRNNRRMRGRGCANPLSCLTTLIFLLVVVVCPVFMLPMMLARFAQMGLAGLRYGASVDITTGEEARWSHGTLQPVPDPARINAGAVAIASADPGFRARALTDWAHAASMLIRHSLMSGDATCTRTFMSNGLYRAHQALLELRARAEVSFQGSWRTIDAYVVEAIRTPLVEEVRVRVTCHGWRQEQHQPTGTMLRGGPGETNWSEDLTFARSTGTITPPGGGLPASRCPSCGANLDLNPGGACRYCKGIVTAGRHDWVLVSWQREAW
jgi:hypothetical protein